MKLLLLQGHQKFEKIFLIRHGSVYVWVSPIWVLQFGQEFTTNRESEIRQEILQKPTILSRTSSNSAHKDNENDFSDNESGKKIDSRVINVE